MDDLVKAVCVYVWRCATHTSARQPAAQSEAFPPAHRPSMEPEHLVETSAKF